MTADAGSGAANRRAPWDWETFYKDRDTPWDDGQPWRPLPDLLSRYAPPGGRVLDIGCGLGGKAAQMASLGYLVLGIDIAPSAVAAARQLAAHAGGAFTVRQADFLAESPNAQFDLAFDRSVWVAFDQPERRMFAKRVAQWLTPGGRWISVTGCADNRDPASGEPDPRGYPRLSLQQIASECEPLFEILEVRRELFGANSDSDFMAWVTVMRARV